MGFMWLLDGAEDGGLWTWIISGFRVREWSLRALMRRRRQLFRYAVLPL